MLERIVRSEQQKDNMRSEALSNATEAEKRAMRAGGLEIMGVHKDPKSGKVTIAHLG